MTTLKTLTECAAVMAAFACQAITPVDLPGAYNATFGTSSHQDFPNTNAEKFDPSNPAQPQTADEKPSEALPMSFFKVKNGVISGPAQSTGNGPREIIIPGDCKVVCLDGFMHNRNLRTIRVMEGVEKISRNSGGYYPGTTIEEIYLPASVRSFSATAFDGNWKALRKVEFAPGSVFTVEDGCIIDTRDMTLVFALPVHSAITVPAKVKTIGEWAFNSNPANEITIQEGTETIERGAFDDCRNLAWLHLPSTVKQISKDKVFDNCGALRSISIPESNTKFKADNGLLVNKTTRTLMRSFGPIEEIVIPSDIEIIGEGAFSFCKTLVSATVPDTVKRIENGAFSYCENLVRLDLPKKMEFCDSHFIMGCRNLPRIRIPVGMRELAGNFAIGECSSLEEIILPDGLTSINSAGMGAICRCNNLKTIFLSASVSKISSGSTFSENPNLQSFKVDRANQAFCAKDGVLFSKDMTRLIRFPNAKKGKYVIPNTVTTIDNGAFSDCPGLTSVVIPKGVEKLGFNTFKNCSSLQSVTIKGNIEADKNIFSGTPENLVVLVSGKWNGPNDKWQGKTVRRTQK